MSKVKVIPYSDEFVKSHENFAIKVWPDKRRRRVENYIRWKFRGPAKGEVNGLLLVVRGDEVVGQLGLIPVKVKYGEKVFDAQWACELMVDPEVRDKGIGSRLFEVALNRGMITLGNNPSLKANKLMLKMGFSPIKSGRIMVFPLDAKYALKWIIPEELSFTISVISKLVQPYLNVRRKRVKSSAGRFMICRWEEVSDLISKRQSQIRYLQVLHDMEFLKWRAEGIEHFSVRMQGAKSEDGSYCVHQPFYPYYNIVDWHCSNPGELRSMISLIMEQALNSGSQVIQIIANDEEEERWLSKIGFLRSRNYERILHHSKTNTLNKAEEFYFTLYDTDINL